MSINLRASKEDRQEVLSNTPKYAFNIGDKVKIKYGTTIPGIVIHIFEYENIIEYIIRCDESLNFYKKTGSNTGCAGKMIVARASAMEKIE